MNDGNMKKKRKDSFQNAIFISFIFSGFGSILNYSFQIMLGNMLTVEDFGVFNSINSLAANLVIVYTPLSIMICQITASNRDNLEKNQGIYKQVLTITLGIVLITILGGGLLFNIIKGRFGIDNLFQWIVILLMIGISGIYTIIMSIIQGLERFILYGVIGDFLILIKLLLSLRNIKNGMDVHGIIWAMLLSYLCMIIVAALTLNKQWKKNKEAAYEYLGASEIFELYGVTFLVQILVSFYINGGEIILMDYLFNNREIGLYSSAATLGKVSLYIISIISVVLFPRVANRRTQGLETKTIFYKTIFFSILMALMYSAFLLVSGKRIIPIMFGEEYIFALDYINAIVIFTIPLSTLSVIHNYFLGIGKVKEYAKVLGIITVLAITIIILFVENIKLVPVILGSALYVVLIWSLMYVKKGYSV